MRRAITAVILGTMALTPAAGAQPLNRAAPSETAKKPEHKITTEPARLNMGWMLPSTKKDGTVVLKNTSNEVVKLSRVTSSCTCTVGSLTEDQKTLKPGESTELTVTLKSGANTGPMVQRAYVWYEGSREPFELYVNADVSLPVKTDPTFVNLLGAEKSGRIRLESLDGTAFRVTSADGGTPKVYDVDGNPADASVPVLECIVEFDYTGIADEDLDRWFLIETDHPEARELPLRVLHRSLYRAVESRPTWTLAEDRFILGRMQAGDSVEKEVTFKALEKDEDVTGVRIESEGLDAEIVSLKRDGRDVVATIRFVATGGETGLIKSAIIVTAEGQEQKADVIARVEAAS